MALAAREREQRALELKQLNRSRLLRNDSESPAPPATSASAPPAANASAPAAANASARNGKGSPRTHCMSQTAIIFHN